MSRRGVLAAAVVLTAVGVLMSWPPVAQDPGYHQLADQRSLLGIPNALNVLSNLPFAIVGLWGLAATWRGPWREAGPHHDPWLRVPYATFFGGTVLTALGSSYYHLAPDNWGLAWDRLPMTLAFMGLLAAVLAERLSVLAARRLFGWLLAMGAGSVVYWYGSELRGAGDLRPYALVQFGSLSAVVMLLLLFPRRGGDARYLVVGLATYAAAKGLEMADRAVYDLARVVSGHTLKHVVAAAGIACVAAMVGRRTRTSDSVGGSEATARAAGFNPDARAGVQGGAPQHPLARSG